ncbi:hypothetical protein OG394_10065 [Kribbella sp. NBC_01245]|uniref:hypothetical protein n=1 Tax=Kribbella sp. NBC_01245 TaxID=2903578 RepID=UPI002E2AA5F0|nr:hypothetical protein [Kribbella sp. NBC_01245]
MTRRQLWTRRLGVFLGAIYLLFGVLETIRVFTSGGGGLVFWFGSLVGGGTLVLLGTLGLRSRPTSALGAVILGAFTATLATAWTLVLPLLALLLIILRLKDLPSVPTHNPAQ